MIIFLYGADTYRSRQKLQEIIGHYKEVHKSGLNLRFFEGDSFDYQDFQDEFRQMPMFQEKKLLILKNIFRNDEFKNSFLENGAKFADSKDIIVFYENEEISPKDSLFKFLIENSKVQEFQLLGGIKLANWAKKEFAGLRAEIRQEALPRLISFVGNDLWQLSGEIQKLASFKKNNAVELEDVNLLVGAKVETDIFKTIEALAMRNKREAISLVHGHLEKGDNPLYLLSMISFQFRNILIMKKTGRLAGNPYFVRKINYLSQSFTLEELKKIYYRIFEADLNIKTGKVDSETALDLLITEI